MPNANLVAAQNQLRNLVSIYNSNFDQYQQATYNETQVRVDFVNPFFQLLGWDVLNEAGKIDYRTLKPVLFEMPTYEYLRTGDVIGKCMNLDQ